MWIITKSGQTVRELSTRERSLLISRAQQTLRLAEQEEISKLLRKVRLDDHWLGCDCSKPMPVMNITLRDSGTLQVKNNPTGPVHAPTCPLLKQDSGFDDQAAKPKAAQATRVAPDSSLMLHREFSATERADGPKISRSNASPSSAPKKHLLSLLLTIFEAAGLHEYDPANEKNIGDQFQRLREALWRFQLVPGVPAQSFSDTRIDKQRLTRLSKSLRESSSFGRHRRYGVMVDQVDGVRGRELLLRGEEKMSFFGHVERWESASGPVLVLATVTTQAPSSNFFELGHIATIPVLSSRHFMPVVSDQERENLKSVLGLLGWFHKERSTRIILRRQLFADMHWLELQGRGKQLLVELAGSALPCSSDGAQVLTLADCEGDISVLKKRIVRYFLGDA